MASKSLEIIWKGRDDGVVATMKSQGASADQLKRKYQELESAKSNSAKTKKGAAKSDDREEAQGLGKLNELFGRSSQLGQIGKLIKGGGAVFAVTAIANEIGKAADKATELKKEFDAGRTSAGGVAAGIAESLPVLGSMTTAFDKTLNLLAQFPGLSNSWVGSLLKLKDRKYAEDMKGEETMRKALLDAQSESLRTQIKLQRELASNTASTNRKLAMAGSEGYAHDNAERSSNLAEKRQSLEDKRREALAGAEKDRLDRANKADADTTMTAAQKFEFRQQLQVQHRRNLAQINQNYDKLDRNEVLLFESEDINARARAHVEAYRVAEEYHQKIHDLEVQAGADRKRVLGFTAAAELDTIAKSAEDKKQAIDRALEEQVKKAPPEDAQRLRDGATAEKAAVDRSAALAAENVQYVAQRAARTELADIELAQLQRRAAAGDVLAQVEAQQLQVRKAEVEEAEKLNRIARDTTLTEDQRLQAQRELRELKAAEAGEATKRLRDEHEGVLQLQATYGATFADRRQAEQQLAAQRIQDEFRRREAEVATIMASNAATAEQKRQAQDDLTKYAELAGRQYDIETNKKQEHLTPSFQEEENQGALSGVATAARLRYDPAQQQLDVSKEGNALTKQLLELQRQMLVQLQKAKHTEPTTGVFSGNN